MIKDTYDENIISPPPIPNRAIPYIMKFIKYMKTKKKIKEIKDDKN